MNRGGLMAAVRGDPLVLVGYSVGAQRAYLVTTCPAAVGVPRPSPYHSLFRPSSDVPVHEATRYRLALIVLSLRLDPLSPRCTISLWTMISVTYYIFYLFPWEAIRCTFKAPPYLYSRSAPSFFFYLSFGNTFCPLWMPLSYSIRLIIDHYTERR